MTRSGTGDISLLRETFAAEYGTPLRWSEGDGGFLAALGAGGSSLDTGVVVRVARGLGSAQDRNALGLAGLTTLGLVLELLIVKKQLFPGGKHKVSAAVDAGQCLILKFH